MLWLKDSERIDQNRVEVDWRSRVAAVSEDPRKGAWVSHPKELAGRRVFPLVNFGGLLADIPNLKALMLDQSKTSWETAKMIRRELETRSRHQAPQDHESDSMDYLQQIGVAVVTAQIAVEEFANEYLEGDEKRARIREKVKILLPEKTGKPRPSQAEWWASFTKMVEARNEIVHPKGEGIDEEKAQKAWTELIGLRPPPHILAKKIIEHFAQNENKWLYGLAAETPIRYFLSPRGRVTPPTPGVAKKTGRNDPCYCGSGFKYKRCCLLR